MRPRQRTWLSGAGVNAKPSLAVRPSPLDESTSQPRRAAASGPPVDAGFEAFGTGPGPTAPAPCAYRVMLVRFGGAWVPCFATTASLDACLHGKPTTYIYRRRLNARQQQTLAVRVQLRSGLQAWRVVSHGGWEVPGGHLCTVLRRFVHAGLPPSIRCSRSSSATLREPKKHDRI